MAFKLRRQRKPIAHMIAPCAFGWDDASNVHVWIIRGNYVVYSRDYNDGRLDIIGPKDLKMAAEDLFKISLPASTKYIVRTVRAQTEVLAMGTASDFENDTVKYMKKEKVVDNEA